MAKPEGGEYGKSRQDNKMRKRQCTVLLPNGEFSSVSVLGDAPPSGLSLATHFPFGLERSGALGTVPVWSAQLPSAVVFPLQLVPNLHELPGELGDRLFFGPLLAEGDLECVKGLIRSGLTPLEITVAVPEGDPEVKRQRVDAAREKAEQARQAAERKQMDKLLAKQRGLEGENDTNDANDDIDDDVPNYDSGDEHSIEGYDD